MRKTLLAATAVVGLLSASSAFAATMQCAPSQQVTTVYPTGSTYTADADGIVTSVDQRDVNALHQTGCQQVGVSGYTLIGRIVGANMNSTADQPATLFIAPTAYYVPGHMVVKDCTVSLTTAAGAVYDAASKGGNRIYGSGTTQAFSGCTGAGTAQNVVGLSGAAVVDGQSLPPILSLTTGQGAAAKANVYFYGTVLGQ